MKNKSISDFVAASMNAVINSDSHKSLFNTQYKFASDENDARAKKCEECGGKLDKHGKCNCDSSSAWDKNSAKSCHKCGKDKDMCYCMPADDDMPLPADDDMADGPVVSGNGSEISFPPDVIKAKPPAGGSAPAKADDHKMHSHAAFDVAIDSLLTASAALDSIGMGNGSTLSLKLASLVVEAKKKMSPAEKKKLMERLQKGKKGKKPADKSSGSSSSSSSSSKSDKLKSSDMSKKASLRKNAFLTVPTTAVMLYFTPKLAPNMVEGLKQDLANYGESIAASDLVMVLSKHMADARSAVKEFLMSLASKL